MSLYASGKDSFRTLTQIASNSIAEPPWFAIPLNAEQDEDAITAYFQIPAALQGHIQVEASDRSVTIWGKLGRDNRRPMRLCRLPWPVLADHIETTQLGETLRVRMPKKQGDAAASGR